MALINFIETFFFISLAITFILIVMLVYHFKDRLGLLEQKCDTMFEILNNMIKEMKNIKQQTMIEISERQIQMNQNHVLPQPIESITDLDDSDDDSDNDNSSETSSEFNEEVSNVITTNNSENSFKKIIVEDVLEEPHKIEKLDQSEEPINNIINDLEELEIDSIGEDVPSENDQSENDHSENDQSDSLVNNEDHIKIDYKTLEISVLRAMVTSRGISDDVKKTKKSELIKMLQNADTSD